MAYIVTIEYSNPGVITRVRNSELDIPRHETPMGEFDSYDEALDHMQMMRGGEITLCSLTESL